MKKRLLGIVLIFPALAHAHAGAGEGFLRGLQHPLGGVDHVLVMLALGALVGLRVAGAFRQLLASAVLVGFVALFHGHAHGMEGLAYGAGFLTATGLLLAIGLALALLAPRIGRKVARP